MNFKFQSLTLNFHKNEITVPFSKHITYIHGQIGTGKSTIARLIDFCLGADLVKTTAIGQELVSVQLLASIGSNEVNFKRPVDSNRIEISWLDSQNNSYRVLSSLNTESVEPIIGNNVFNFSDLIFYFMGVTPVKVSLSSTYSTSKPVRLSFRDILWYCYLEQGGLDSSFYKLEAPILMQKSRSAFRFIIGNLTEKMAALEEEKFNVRKEKSENTAKVNQLNVFLKKFGFNSEQEINDKIESAKKDVEVYKEKLERLNSGHSEEPHPGDKLKIALMGLRTDIDNEKQTLADLDFKIKEQESLKSELLTAKAKLLRINSSKSVFTSVSFEKCPSCGMMVKHNEEKNVCPLCKQEPSTAETVTLEIELMKKDLDSRIEELDESIGRHSSSREVQTRKLRGLVEQKKVLDKQLEDQTKDYDSRFLANYREFERQIAMLTERISGLQQVIEMPRAVGSLELAIGSLTAKENVLKRQIQEEEERAELSKLYVKEIEAMFLNALVESGYPEVTPEDQVKIDTTTWTPEVLSKGRQSVSWNYEAAGSGGKKTLFNACFALAFHQVAEKHNLPLPSFIIIDTPMKNISEGVNKVIFQSFYRYLYKVANTTLSKTQFIIIDKEYCAPEISGVEVLERFMTQSDRLIPGYFGP